MVDTRTMRWQDWVNLVLGAWLFISPWVIGFYSQMPGQSWNFFVIGAAMAVFAIVGLNVYSLWEEWVNLVLGIWMVISPWIVGYSGTVAARDDSIIVGVVVGVLAIWALADRNRLLGDGTANRSLSH